MPIINLFPTTVGSVDAWTLGAGATKPIACQSDDGDTSYITASSAANEAFNMDPLPADAVAINGNVITIAKARNTSAGSITVIQRYSGANNSSGGLATTGSYADYQVSSATAPGGAGWTPAIVNATEARVDWVSGNQRVTLMRHVVDYQASARGFAFNVASFLGPLVAVGLHEIPRLAEYIRQLTRGNFRIKPDEYAQVWGALHAPSRVYLL